MVARALWRSEARKVGLCLGYAPAQAVGECRGVAKAQPCVPLISTMHGQPFLIPLAINYVENCKMSLGVTLFHRIDVPIRALSLSYSV